jgi:hypothetical protein
MEGKSEQLLKVMASMIRTIALELGTPEAVADAIVLICRHVARFATGQDYQGEWWSGTSQFPVGQREMASMQICVWWYNWLWL